MNNTTTTTFTTGTAGVASTGTTAIPTTTAAAASTTSIPTTVGTTTTRSTHIGEFLTGTTAAEPAPAANVTLSESILSADWETIWVSFNLIIVILLCLKSHQ